MNKIMQMLFCVEIEKGEGIFLWFIAKYWVFIKCATLSLHTKGIKHKHLRKGPPLSYFLYVNSLRFLLQT